MPRKAELRVAYEWNCPVCKCQNFVSSCAVELTPEDAEHMHEDYPDVPPEDWLERGNFLTHPDDVTCTVCGGDFEVAEGSG